MGRLLRTFFAGYDQYESALLAQHLITANRGSTSDYLDRHLSGAWQVFTQPATICPIVLTAL